MAELNKGQLASENNNSFPNNNAGLITPTALRTFNGNMIDSLVDEVSYNIDSASFSSSIAQLQGFSSSLDATFATDAQLTALSTSVAVTDSGQDSKINSLTAATSSYITSAQTASMNVLSSSYAVTASFALNAGASVDTGSLVTTSSFNAYTQSNDSKVNSLINKTGSFATTGSNIFQGNQFITGAILQSSSLANEFTRVQIANSNKAFFGEANTLLSLVGDSQGIFDFYADGGNYDTLNIVVNQNDGTTFRDWKGNAYNNWLKIPTNTGANPAPQFVRGLDVSGSFNASGSAKVNGNTEITGSLVINSNLTAPTGWALNVTGSISSTSAIRVTGSAGIFAATPTTVQLSGSSFNMLTGRGYYQNSFNGQTISIFASGSSNIGGFNNAPVGKSGIAISSGSGVTSYYFPIVFETGLGYTNGTVGITTPLSASNGITASSATILGNISQSNGNVNLGGNLTVIGELKNTGSVRIDGDLIIDDDGGTTSFLINQRFNTEFLGSNLRWQEAAKKVTWEVFESEIQLAFAGYSASYDNGFIIDIKNDGTTFSDYNTSFVNQPWLNIPVNNNTNPAPQFKRGLASTGSITIQSGSGDLYVHGHKQFNGGMFQNNTTLSGSAGVSQSIDLPVTDLSYGVSIGNSSRITIANAGTYNIQFSAQIETSAGADSVYIWFKKNGTNITDSATKVVLANNTAQTMTVNILSDAAANDYYELVWQSTNGNARILSEAASGNIPLIPAVIVTVTQVR